MRAWAKGLLGAEAAVGLLIGHRAWLHREDFTGIAVESGRDSFTGSVIASVDWEAAVAALETGALPCSGSEGQVLRLAASIAGAAAVDLGSALSGLDEGNTALVASAVLRAAGHRGLAAAFGGGQW
jgi:hypothetical protein